MTAPPRPPPLSPAQQALAAALDAEVRPVAVQRVRLSLAYGGRQTPRELSDAEAIEALAALTGRAA